MMKRVEIRSAHYSETRIYDGNSERVMEWVRDGVRHIDPENTHVCLTVGHVSVISLVDCPHHCYHFVRLDTGPVLSSNVDLMTISLSKATLRVATYCRTREWHILGLIIILLLSLSLSLCRTNALKKHKFY